MKTVLKISLILNLGLLALLVFAWSNQGTQKVPAARPTIIASAQPAAISAPASARPTEAAPFRWSMLESADYCTYIKNLRDIGCPETTLRAIVTADVDGVYAAKHDELEQQLTALLRGSWAERLTTYANQQHLAAEMQQLPGEKRAEIDDLLGLKPQAIPFVASCESLQPQQHPMTLPMVMQNIDLAQLDFNDQQKQIFSNVRQQFLGDIGGPNQDPHDPAYLARWQMAQSSADNMLEAMLGRDAYAQIQIAQYQKSLESRYQ
jgi:hypothetical protein